MSALAIPAGRNAAGAPSAVDMERVLELIVSDLPSGDLTGRLKRWQYASDRLELELSKEAERLAEKFAIHEVGDELAQVLWQLSHARRRLELRLWRTSPLFCKTR